MVELVAMSILSRFRRSAEPAAPLTDAEKQAAPGQHFSPADAPAQAQIIVRRAPSLPAFALTGLLLGLLLALPVTLLGAESPSYTFEAVYGVMAVICGTLCTTLALLLALLLERRSKKKTSVYRAISQD